MQPMPREVVNAQSAKVYKYTEGVSSLSAHYPPTSTTTTRTNSPSDNQHPSQLQHYHTAYDFHQQKKKFPITYHTYHRLITMVRLLITSLTALVLSLAAVNAQTGPINAASYPPPNQVPDINSPQVQAWLKVRSCSRVFFLAYDHFFSPLSKHL